MQSLIAEVQGHWLTLLAAGALFARCAWLAR